MASKRAASRSRASISLQRAVPLLRGNSAPPHAVDYLAV